VTSTTERASAVFSLRAGARVIFLPLALLTLTPARGPEQAPPSAAQPPPAQIAVNVNLVNVDVTVADASSEFVGNLTRERFRILDDGVAQPITHFAAIEAPAQVLVLVETSPAVYLIHRGHLQAAYSLLGGLAPDDRVALATYAEAARLTLEFTDDKRAVTDAMNRLNFGLGMAQLNLSDSLSAVLEYLRPLPGKKAIVLLGTGLDGSEPGSRQALEQKLAASEVMILPIALGGELREPDKKKKAPVNPQLAQEAALSFEQADLLLKALAEETGGQAYFPKNARDFPAIYKQVASLLRHQYSLGFQPAAHDGRFHKIEVQIVEDAGHLVTGKDGKPLFRLSHRKRYLAPVN
jgi:Ca-activated chloride channel family protein